MSKSHPLPSLNWLRAFEAAGRAGSFKLAAAELNVSPSTISHQVRDLEALLGMPLFSRGAHGIELTREGRSYLAPLTSGFELIRSAAPTFPAVAARFRIGAFPFLANEILTPNLAGLRDLLPESTIKLHTRTELATLLHVNPEERLEVVVRYGKPDGRYPGFISDKLFDVSIVPIVCATGDTIRSVDELLAQPLIRVLGPFAGWERWLAAFSPEIRMPAFSIETDSFHAAALSVERGEGVCLGIMPYMKPWLEDGRVHALTEFSLPINEQAAVAVYAPHNQAHPSISIFTRWLRELLA